MCEFTTCRWWWNVQSKLMMENEIYYLGAKSVC